MLALVLAACGDKSGGSDPVPDASAGNTPDTSTPTQTDAAAGSDSSTTQPDAAVDAGPPPPPECTKPADCASKVCNSNGTCATPSPTDGVLNGTETDVDCGGNAAPACGIQKKCADPLDCTTGVCKDTPQGKLCQAPSPTDTVKNGTETDVDCGGNAAPACADGKECAVRGDCVSDVCTNKKCVAAVCDDGVKNSSETDVDCGGAGCPRCADNKTCKVAGDCASGVCQDKGTGLKCQPPTFTDAVKNGTETDVDCGGGGPLCATGKACKQHSDCASDGCDYKKTCAIKRSCTAQNGGDTCGFGGPGSRGDATWESCCATAPAGNGGIQANKYQVTSGRMRAFMDRVNGDVRTFIQQARAANKLNGAIMDPRWDLYLPTSMVGCEQLGNCGAEELVDREYTQPAQNAYRGIFTSAYRHLGGTIFNGQSLGQQGCSVGSPGTHSYWMSDTVQANYFGDVPAEHSQAIYDTKALNCVNYLMAQSFCIWDGGRLETQAEYQALSGQTNNGGAVNGPVPWGSPLPKGQSSSTYFAFRFPTADDASLRALNLPTNDPNYRYIPQAGWSIEWATQLYSYEYPNLVNSDYIVFINAPGRLRARSPNGHADFVGPMMEITSDVNNVSATPASTATRWTANGSFEGHQWGFYGWNFSLLNKYGKQSLRCVYP
jgi:hypothetical protein